MSKQGTNGSEIHRIKEFTHYNREEFERMYKICKPLIKKLSKILILEDSMLIKI